MAEPGGQGPGEKRGKLGVQAHQAHPVGQAFGLEYGTLTNRFSSAKDKESRAQPDRARHARAPPGPARLGEGQVQSVIGDRITVNFEHAGKLLINAALVELGDHRSPRLTLGQTSPAPAAAPGGLRQRGMRTKCCQRINIRIRECRP
ncbi:DUF3553 domain-containing protein [Dankookia sp. P2]|uniref:DUF3553 domain-containing protein n=1 Tax=Dankookia sp. P2 TaxID=3423955 RepID=UPI003D6675B9